MNDYSNPKNEFEEASSGEFENGSLIGETYRVIAFVGEGGMGLVYKVEHILMNKILALKVLKTEQFSVAAWKRFRAEAQAIARLDHANVVKIYDMNQTADGRPYYTMDLIEGRSLADYLDDFDRMSIADALPVFRQVCAGLAYAHERGIIHRDIKPGNIMLVGFGENRENAYKSAIKIVDFGIAKLVDDGGHTIQGLTKPGEIFGSPLYMSPEQCSGIKLDARADMYSLGVAMFQVLAGRAPFVGRSAIETTIMHQSQTPPTLHAVAADISFPPALERVVAKMLAKKPDERFKNLSEVANALLLIEREESSGEREPGGRRSSVIALYNQPQTTTVTKNAEYGTLSFALIIFALLLVGTGAAAVIIYKPDIDQKSEFRPSTLPLPALSAKSVKTARNSDLQDRDLDRLNPIAEVQRFLTTQQKFSSAFEGDKVLTFTFPANFSVGEITFIGQGRSHAAQGTIHNASRAYVGFEGGEAVRAYPQLLKRFRPQDLIKLRVSDMRRRDYKLAQNVATLVSLSTLDLPNACLENDDLKYLEHLTKLGDLNIDSCSVSGTALAQSTLLNHVFFLHIHGVKDVSPVLIALLRKNIVKGLVLGECKLTDDDVLKISRMHHLHTLYLRQTNLSDQQLHTLLSLKNLSYLNIDGCNGLTLSSLSTLQQFKKLHSLILPDKLDSRESQQLLKQALPKLINLRKRGWVEL